MAEQREREPATAFERWVLPYLTDSSLWPVLAVAAAIAATIGAAVLLLALRRQPAALAALVLLAGVTAHALYEDVRAHRTPWAGGAALALWALSAAAAWGAVRLGLS